MFSRTSINSMGDFDVSRLRIDRGCLPTSQTKILAMRLKEVILGGDKPDCFLYVVVKK